MSDTSRASERDTTVADAAVLQGVVRRLAPGAVRVRVYRTPGGRYPVTVLDSRGRPTLLPPSDAIALGRWLGTRFPDADWDFPQVYDIAAGSLVDPAGTGR